MLAGERERKRKKKKIFNDAEKIHPSITLNKRKKRGCVIERGLCSSLLSYSLDMLISKKETIYSTSAI
jgi:hypothetical protein